MTQTFLAQAFPDMARSADVAPFIGYTQAIAAVAQLSNGCNDAAIAPDDPKLEAAQHALKMALEPWGGRVPVWWDFDPQPDATPNVFEFGHRVTVGVDASDGQIFGRFSLFSSLHFAMCFGKASSVIASKTVTVDIDPLAPHPPDDILKIESASATARVSVPSEPTAGLAAAISSRSAEAMVTDLLGRIEAHSLAKCAATMHAARVGVSSLLRIEREQLVARMIDQEAQRVWKLAKYVLRGFRPQLPTELNATLGSAIDTMMAHDPRSINGLSHMANASLSLAKSALAAQMHEDLMAGRLDQRRIAELMGERPGAEVVGRAVLEPVLMELKD